MLAYGGDDGSKRAAYAAFPDWVEMQLWRRQLRGGDLFVDVGANVGLYTILAAELGCEVIALEPQALARDRLIANLQLNGMRAEVIPAALAERPGSVRMRGPDSLRQHLSAAADAGPLVEARTLDDVLGDRFAAGVKIDVEGAERRVLCGAERALGNGRIGLLQLEWNEMSEVNFGETRAELAELVLSHGYELHRPGSDGTLRQVPDLSYGSDIFARPVAGSRLAGSSTTALGSSSNPSRQSCGR